MLGLTVTPPLHQLPISKFPRHNPCSFSSSSSSSLFKSKTLSVKFASNGDNNFSSDSKKNGGGTEEQMGSDTGGKPKKGGRPILNVRWGDLLNPDPDNIIAVGLTGLLTWASVQVVAQLFLVTLAILVAALKYSFIAALILFILITLL